MFPTRNGTGVLFIPVYIDHGSTSRQSDGACRRYVVEGQLQIVYATQLSGCRREV